MGAAFDGVPFLPSRFWDAEDDPRFWDAEDRIVLGYISRPFRLSLHVLGDVSPRQRLSSAWAVGPNVK